MLSSLVEMVCLGVGNEPVVADPNDRISVILKRFCERVIAHPHQNCDL